MKFKIKKFVSICCVSGLLGMSIFHNALLNVKAITDVNIDEAHALESKSELLENQKQVNDSNFIDLSNINNSNVKFYKHTAEEYVNLILNDEKIPNEKKTEMITEVYSLEQSRSAWDYWTFYDVCPVTSTYSCRPCFYAYARFASGTGYPEEIARVQYGTVDLKYNGISKEFNGVLYYNLESGNRLYWDLNGNFYNHGSTEISLGIEIGIGGGASTNFSVSSSSSHYAYCHKYDRVTF